MPWRPQLHFTADHQWINDPNGLVYHDGEFHLFHQLNPHGSQWGHMSWGHAVSTDLLTWTRLPPALTPYPARVPGADTFIFSGSAIAASSGDRLLAFYTAHERVGDEPINESVSLAVSDDRGRTWRRSAGGPVLDVGRRHFRDPKVFRHDGRLLMVIAVADEHRVEFHASDDDGETWERVGTFAAPDRASARRAWECPDLVPVGVEGSAERRWVLLVSADHPSDDPYSGMFVWTGDFDGRTFTPDRTDPQWLDHGKDFFAAVTYNGRAADEPPVLLGWASNWAYASRLPALPWRGMMALPRELSLVERGGVLVVAQRPCRQFDALDDVAGSGPADVLDIVFSVAEGVGGVIVSGSDGSSCTVGVDVDVREVWCDRTGADAFGVGESFATVERAPVPVSDRPVDVRVVVDGCLVEVFADGGTVVLTELAFVTAPRRVVPFGAVDAGLRVRRPRAPHALDDAATG